LDVQQEGHGDERIHPALPSSFVGSRAYRAEQVSDALALASRFQRPQGMVTVTTNPNWPEIRVVLRPGQNATVVPQITVRIFSARLKRFMAAFKRPTRSCRLPPSTMWCRGRCPERINRG
ncbi:unnamed protein product, partial [Tilletia controversa]